jgi:methylated-DNA-[protein]-cysteine S-methyltransferase
MTTQMIESAAFMSPAGLIEITGGSTGIQSLYFRDGGQPVFAGSDLLKECINQVEEYFAGSRMVFDLPLDPHGTNFQKKVWHELLRIPYGEVITYSTLAERIGGRQYTRVAGGANGRNSFIFRSPLSQKIP